MLFTSYKLRKGMAILESEGPWELAKRFIIRMKHCIPQAHCYVVKYERESINPVQLPTIDVDIEEISVDDEEKLDELTLLDAWKIEKSVTLQTLKEGWVGYTANHMGHIVATLWVALKDFDEPHLGFSFKLAADESYWWRGWCVPEFRGKGIIPFMIWYVLDDLAKRYEKTTGYYIMRTNNRAVQRSFEKLGFPIVGRTGFVEIFGFRFNYLWGRDAFKETKQRLLLHKAK